MQKSCLIIFCFLSALVAAEENSFHFDTKLVVEYHSHSQLQRDCAVAYLEASFFADAKSIHDVGCGDGKITALLAEKTPWSSVVGCDISQAMIAFAKEHYRKNNLTFVEKDATDLGYQDAFDRVVSFGCLHWLDDQLQALRSIYDSLKLGGKALLVASPRLSEDDLQSACGKTCASPTWSPLFQNFRTPRSFYTEGEYIRLLQEARFSIEKIETSTIEAVFPHRQEFESWVRPVLTPMHHLPVDKRESFLKAIFAELVERGCVDSDGRVHLHVGKVEIQVNKPVLTPAA